MARTPQIPSRPPCRLYLITPPAVPDLEAFATALTGPTWRSGAGATGSMSVRTTPLWRMRGE